MVLQRALWGKWGWWGVVLAPGVGVGVVLVSGLGGVWCWRRAWGWRRGAMMVPGLGAVLAPGVGMALGVVLVLNAWM
ncbi:hypothetical protein [uncultured Lawsonella sp.]|uniref:hypothetical protein n=1 Tax=uncultured Lawsonella sp. TaxID=1847727 RepID=UPI0025EB558F|nr:hypothetical protein [uncultured Lawsonella sp.]